jgi:hypothetical protein
MNMTEVMSSTNASLRGLPTSIHEAIETQFAFLEGGLHGTSQNTLLLASIMKISGADIKSLINLNREQIAIGRVTSAESNALNTTLGQVNRDQKVSFGRLIGSLNSLSRRLATLGGLGMTAEVQDAQLRMIGRLGAGSDKLVSALFEKMFDPKQSMGTEQLLQVFDQLQTLRAPGGMTEENINKFISTAGGTFDSMNEMAKMMPVQIREGFLEQWGGDEGLGGIASRLLDFQETMSEVDIKLGESNAKFRENLDTFKNTALKPIQIVLQWLGGALMKIISFAPRLFTGLTASLTTLFIWTRFTNSARKMNTLALQQNTAALLGSRAQPALLGGRLTPWGIVASIVVGGLVAGFTPKIESMEQDLADINAKTPDPAKATSLFADRSSTIIKEAIAATIFGGNELLAAINSGQMELAGSMLRVGDILLEEREDKGVPGSPF